MVVSILKFSGIFLFLSLVFNLNMDSGLLAQLKIPSTILHNTLTALVFTGMIHKFNKWVVVFICWLLFYANVIHVQGSVPYLNYELAAAIALTLGFAPSLEKMIEQ